MAADRGREHIKHQWHLRSTLTYKYETKKMSSQTKRAKAKKLSKDHLKCNKPKRTPSHKTKSHVVKACKDGKEKIIRFGQQGVKGAGKNPKSEKDKARKNHIMQDTMPKILIPISSLLDTGHIKLSGN